MSAELLRELAYVKALFQLRTIEAIIRGPIEIDAAQLRRTEPTVSLDACLTGEAGASNLPNPFPSAPSPGPAGGVSSPNQQELHDGC